MGQKLLMIDDDYGLVDHVKKIFTPSEVEIVHAFNFLSGSRMLAQHRFSIIIMNLNLPGAISSFDFLEDLRITMPIPILTVGSTTSKERIRAYHLGADLFIQTPIDPLELAAAIRALLRRYYTLNREAELQEGGMAIHHKGLVLNQRRRTAVMAGRPIVLSRKEFDILYFLASNPGIVFSQDTIYERVWGEEFTFASRCVTDHISSIRQKLGQQSSDENYIETVYGVGYRFASSP